jgi:hypothetical protein
MSPSTAPETVSVDSFPVVGVGASAGGLEAFTRLLRCFPPAPGLALLLVQHLDPTHDSLLVDILGRETAMPVRQGTEGMPVEVNNVYVIPPDTRMGVESGLIKLYPRGERKAPHMPVDHLFRSLSSAGRVEALAFRRRLQQVFRVGRGEFSDRVGDSSGIGPSQVPGMLPLAEPRSIRLIVSRNPRDFSRPPGRKTLADLRSEQDF